MRFAAVVARMWLACACLAQEMPVPVFGTTVVDNGGLRGTIYYLKPSTGVLPDNFHRFQPKGTIYTRSLNVTPRFFKEGFPGVTKRVEWFAIDYEGKFWIEKAGEYRFALTSDDGSLLYIDDVLLVINDGVHPPRTREGLVKLARGVHTLRVPYFQGPRESVALVLEVAGEGESLRVFSMDEFTPPPSN